MNLPGISIYTDDDKGVGANYKDKYEFERNQILMADYEDIKASENDRR